VYGINKNRRYYNSRGGTTNEIDEIKKEIEVLNNKVKELENRKKFKYLSVDDDKNLERTISCLEAFLFPASFCKKLTLTAKLQAFSDLNRGDSNCRWFMRFDEVNNKIRINSDQLQSISIVYFYSEEIVEEALRIYKDEIEEVSK